MESKDQRVADDVEIDVSDASRRQIGAAILSIFGGAVLSGCAGAEESGAAPPMLGQSVEALTGTANIRWFDKIEAPLSPPTATLKNTAGTASWQVAIALGYWQPGDGGGGVFFWQNSTPPALPADDGGTIFQVGSGRWIRIYSGPLNVKWFGAKGDGSSVALDMTTETQRIQKAIDAAAALSGLAGGEVWLPPTPSGYRVNGTITVKKYTTLRGSQRGVSFGKKNFDPTSNGGSTMIIDHTGDGFSLQSSATVDGLEIWYPRQQVNGSPVVPPIAHGYTFITETDAHAVTIRNVVATNPYAFIFIQAGGATIENIRAWPLRRGIFLGRCQDIVRVKSVHFNPNVWLAGQTSQNLLNYVAANGEAFVVAGAETFMFDGIHAWGYYRGFFAFGNDWSEPPAIRGSDGHILNFMFDQCYEGILIENRGLQNQGLRCIGGGIIPKQYGIRFIDAFDGGGNAMEFPRVHLSHVMIFNGATYPYAVLLGSNSRARVWLHGCELANFSAAGVSNLSPYSIGRLVACEFPLGGAHINNTGGSSWTESLGM